MMVIILYIVAFALGMLFGMYVIYPMINKSSNKGKDLLFTEPLTATDDRYSNIVDEDQNVVYMNNIPDTGMNIDEVQLLYQQSKEKLDIGSKKVININKPMKSALRISRSKHNCILKFNQALRNVAINMYTRAVDFEITLWDENMSVICDLKRDGNCLSDRVNGQTICSDVFLNDHDNSIVSLEFINGRSVCVNTRTVINNLSASLKYIEINPAHVQGVFVQSMVANDDDDIN